MSYIVWLLFPIIIILIGLLLFSHWYLFNIGQFLYLIGAGVLITSLLAWPINNIAATADIKSIEAVRILYLDKSGLLDSERYAMGIKVSEANEKIAKIRYYSNHILFKMFWPDEGRNLQFISGEKNERI